MTKPNTKNATLPAEQEREAGKAATFVLPLTMLEDLKEAAYVESKDTGKRVTQTEILVRAFRADFIKRHGKR